MLPRSLFLAPALAVSLAVAPVASGQVAEPEPATMADRASGNWFGFRDALARRGVEVDLVVQGDQSTNLKGGLRRGGALRKPIRAALDVDTDRLVGWRGGHFHVGVQALHGRHATDLLVGDAQGFDNVDALPFHQVSEAWLEQAWGDGRLRIKLGKADASSEFAHVEHGGEFLNSAAGVSPTIQGFPTYPDPATSVAILADPTPWLFVGAGLYDGATQAGCHGRTGNRGLGTFFGSPSALFAVGEAGARYTVRGRAGRLGFGSWRHTGSFPGFDGTERRGTAGWYVVFDQAVLREELSGRGFGVFAQVGTAESRVAEIDRHVSVGLSATGALPGRDRDTAGLLVTSVRFSPRLAGGRETAIELFYRYELRAWIGVTLDLQHVHDPGGRHAPDALVGTLRLAVSL